MALDLKLYWNWKYTLESNPLHGGGWVMGPVFLVHVACFIFVLVVSGRDKIDMPCTPLM